MRAGQRKIGFVLAASNHGPLIVNRFDRHEVGTRFFGVGAQILEQGAFDPPEIETLLLLLRYRRQYFGDGAVMIDCGANIGVHTVEAAVAMSGWGSVLAIEAQERVFYALAGNIALNNCFNARAVHAAVAARDGTMRVPAPDYLRPASFGSLELRPRPEHEDIGQQIDYSESATQEIRTIALDSLPLTRVDFVKIDVEGMEAEVLAGAATMLVAHRPIVMVEWIKSDKAELRARLQGFGYRVFEGSMNLLAVHPDDPTIGHLRQQTPP